MSDSLRHCPECGCPLVSEIKFCGGCGADLRSFRDVSEGPSPASPKAPAPKHQKTMMGLPGMMPPAAPPAEEPKVSKQTIFGVPSMVSAPADETAPAAPAPVVAPTPAPVPAPAPAPIVAQPSADEAPRFQAPPARPRHQVSYSEPPPRESTGEFALPTRKFPLKPVLAICAALLLVAFVMFLLRTLGADEAPVTEVVEADQTTASPAPEQAPLVPEPGFTYADFAADPVAHRGRVVELRGTLYSVGPAAEGRSLQMLVDGCVAGQHCPVWIDFAGDAPAQSGDRVRVVGRIIGEQRFRVRGSQDEISTVPKLTARTLAPIEP